MSAKTKFTSRIARCARLARFSYYDFVLLALPVVLLAGPVVGATLSVPFHVGTTAAGLAAAFVLADAMFKRPPTGRSA
ncbi:hypothetical protein [Haladaptatus salinisoli]|uniref:hypothetical protein n=1 Tax=Haladaptatus salinisoli TaxID=2884876 RepID=UPI001D0B9387|nr:hypothetical protein [Haladaptatus salinisoli]